MNSGINFNDYAINLDYGDHDSPSEGMCIMECVAYIQGEKHTDHPECASPTLTSFAITLNDNVAMEERNGLIKYVLRLAGSKGTAEIERQRICMIANFVIHTVAPYLMTILGQDQKASSFRELPEVTSLGGFHEVLIKASHLLDIHTVNPKLTYNGIYYTLDALCHAHMLDDESLMKGEFNLNPCLTLVSLHGYDERCTNPENVGSIPALYSAQLCELLDRMLELTDPVASEPAIPKLQELVAITA